MTRTKGSAIGLAVTGSFGVLALAVGGLLPPAAAMVALAGLGASYWVGPLWASHLGAPQRRWLAVGVLIAAGVVVGERALHGADNVYSLLGGVLVATAIAQALTMQSKRDQLVGLIQAVFMLVVAGGESPIASFFLIVVFGWAAALVTLICIVQLPEVQPSEPVARVQGEWALKRLDVQVATTLTLALACGVAVFLLIPSVPPPQTLPSLPHLGHPIAPGGDEQSAVPRDAQNYTDGNLDLRSRGELGDEPLVEVPANSPMYWRSATLDVYSAGQWSELSTDVPTANPEGLVQLDPPDLGVSGDWQATSRYDVTLLPDYLGAILAPGDIVAVNSPARTYRVSNGGMGFIGHPVDYTVWSTTTPSSGHLREDGSNVPAPTAGWAFTALPGDLPSRVTGLAQSLAAGTTDRQQVVANIEQYLRQNEKYQLEAPVPLSSDDPVDYFLFESHLGFCEHFASAETVLLRAVGIPARLATGFVGGSVTDHGTRLFKGTDAHAWVEFWIPGMGWVRSDPTAGAVVVPPSTSIASKVEAAVASLLDNQRLRIALGLSVLVGLVVLVIAWRKFRASRPRKQQTSDSTDWATADPPEPLAAFGRLERVMARRGRGREPSQTPVEWAPAIPAGQGSALATVERACYSDQPPSNAERIAAANDLDDYARQMAPRPTTTDQ